MTMNVSRNVAGHGVDPNEKLNKSQIYITTAGYKGTYGYEQLIQILCQAVARPKDAIVLGGSWRVPVIEGLLDKNFIQELKMDGTFNEASFDREYESKWAGDIESAFFDSERFNKLRVLNLPEHKYNNKLNKNSYYVLGVDVGRHECNTEVVVIKVSPLTTGYLMKQVVNIYPIEAENFVMQAVKIKRIFENFKCRAAVVDGNGLGAGLVDLLVVNTHDPDSGETLPGWGVINDEDRAYRNMYDENTIHDAMYIMKANTVLNSEMYAYCKTQIINGRVRFLVDDNIAKNKLMSQSQGQKMTPSQRADYLMPYVQTNILKEQMMNLIQENEGAHIILKQSNRKVPKDKFSALIYGLYYCKLEEDKRGKRRSRGDLSQLMLFSRGRS